MKKFAVGISGGVDSAVAAALLKERGYEVTGIHLYCWDKGPYCTADKDRASALRVAKHLNIPFVVWDLRKEYKKKVINYFFDEYRKGRTPNPDVMCNREIKFGIFMEKALKELKVDKVATGHYARLRRELPITNYQLPNNEPLRLLRGVDETKDQSYFLWILTPKQLEHIVFPIGRMTKKEVRAKAKKLGLPCAERPDSQGICFIGPVNVAKFLREHLPVESGPVVRQRRTGFEVIGEHDGVWFYTEGQRRGFRVSKPSYPLYVIKKDIKTNTLVVGRGKESEVREFEVGEVNWITPLINNEQLTINKCKVGVRIRHLGEIMPARIASPARQLDGSLGGGQSVAGGPAKIKMENGKLINVKLSRPARGVAPGQSVVFYGSTRSTPKGGQAPQVPYEEVLGGGAVEEALLTPTQLVC